MSFRYKSALLSLVSLALIYGWYFSTLIAHRGEMGAGAEAARLGSTVLLVAVVQVAGHILIAITSRDKYRAMDERERGFDWRATSVGYYVLIVGALAAVATLHAGANGPEMGYAVVLAIVIAECARQAIFLILHHRAA